MFDRLATHREVIEREIGFALSWERLDVGRASRTSAVGNGKVDSNGAARVKLLEWAKMATQRMVQSLNARTVAAATACIAGS